MNRRSPFWPPWPPELDDDPWLRLLVVSLLALAAIAFLSTLWLFMLAVALFVQSGAS